MKIKILAFIFMIAKISSSLHYHFHFNNHLQGEKIKIYVGSLPFDVTDTDLFNKFSGKVNITNAHFVMEKEDSSKSTGFGFLEVDR